MRIHDRFYLTKLLSKHFLPILLFIATFIYFLGIWAIVPIERSSLVPRDRQNSYSNHQMLFMLIKYAQTNPQYLRGFYERLSDHEIIDGNEVIELSITQSPQAKQIIDPSLSFDAIQKKYQSTPKWINVSFQLPNKLWLNYHEGARWTYYHYIILFLILIVSLTLIISYAILINIYSSSLRKIKSSASDLGVNMYTKIDTLQGSPLLHDTLVTMKGMQQRIQELVNRNAQILGAISHDLRTPILRIKLNLEYIKDHHTAEKIIHSLEEMENMITELISFSKNAAYKEPKAMVDLNSILLNCCYEYEDMGKQIDYQHVGTAFEFLGARQSLTRCFNNIINNAYKFGDQVWVASSITNNQITITITDNGPGIPEKELKNVLEPFYRTKAGKKASSTGAGLGLSIVTQIVQYHDGEIKLKNAPGKGLEVILDFSNIP